MWEIIENLPGWVKLTGMSVPVIFLFLIFLYINGESDVIEVPKQIAEAKSEVREETFRATEEASRGIFSSFHNMALEITRDLDPGLRSSMIVLIDFLGIVLIIMLVVSVLRAFGIDIPMKPFN